MPSACGVSWSGTSGGKLSEGSIPDPPDHKSHYLNAADTKGDSSFPVVDGEGNLRAGNVRSAWKLRNRGDGVSEECLRKLANAFDSSPLPGSASENAAVRQAIAFSEDEPDRQVGMNLEFQSPRQAVLDDGFNEHGVRVNSDGSLDVRFNAMEPGVRRGVEISEGFLSNVVAHDYSDIPLQLDHSQSQLANVGQIDPQHLQFNDLLQVQAHIPDTGSSVRDDVIADFTHEPPQVTDISVAFHPQSIEVEHSRRGETPRLIDAKIREFSLTPFPAGYDNGGLTPAFSEAVEAAFCGCSEDDDAESYLQKQPHTLITTKHE